MNAHVCACWVSQPLDGQKTQSQIQTVQRVARCIYRLVQQGLWQVNNVTIDFPQSLYLPICTRSVVYSLCSTYGRPNNAFLDQFHPARHGYEKKPAGRLMISASLYALASVVNIYT
jgi:hypothetical protein